MPFKMRLRLLLGSLPKVIAAIVVAVVVGTGLGIGLSTLAGNKSDTGSADSPNAGRGTPTNSNTVTSRTSTTRSASGAPSSVKPSPTTTTSKKTAPASKAPPSAGAKASAVRVHVVSAVLQRAVSASGRRRHRARLSVHVRVTNGGSRTIANVDPVLLAGAPVRPDPSAWITTGSLLRPVPHGFTAGGLLRFETAGAVTDGIASTLRAKLRIAGKTVTLKVTIGSAPQSG